ncbi:MAG: hypothetical protein K6A23_08815 [Butyrivibrio sp.]|nr:hypothetical protein [Butyrivibrio sp.]
MGIQGISGYQMQVQSYSSKINELNKNGDASSMAIASALRQKISSVQGQLTAVQSSNNYDYIKKNLKEDSLKKYLYNKDAQKQLIEASTFEATV